MNKGTIQVYCGDGHGKSTAAYGIALRTAVEGKTAIVIQFMKSKLTDENNYLQRLEPEIKFFRFAKSDDCFDDLSEEEKQEERINLKNGFNYGKKVVSTGACDLLIMDEILGLLEEKIITIEEVEEFLSAKPDEMNIIFTGRVLDERIRPMVDEIYVNVPEL